MPYISHKKRNEPIESILSRKESRRYRHKELAWRFIILFVLISASAYVLYKISDLGFSIIFSISAVLSLICGFAMISRGTIFSERVKTNISVITLLFITSGIIYSIFAKHLYFILIMIVEYFLYSGIGGEICSKLFNDMDS